MNHALTTERLNARAPDRALVTPERGSMILKPRAFWMRQARSWLRQARMWSERFGSEDHDATLGWYLFALLEAERYRSWAREIAPALRPVDELLAQVDEPGDLADELLAEVPS